MRKLAIGLLAALNATLFATLPMSSFAHDTYYGHHWNYFTEVNYRIDNGVPLDWRESLRQGFTPWSGRAGGRGPTFAFRGEDHMTSAYTPCEGPNGVFARDITADGQGGGLALTARCINASGQYAGFSMVFDRNVNWFVGDGAVPDNKWDLQSIATHEAGHSTGWHGHLDGTAGICQGADRNTMCEGSPDPQGFHYLRTLEFHDEHTIENGYPFIQP